MKYAGRYPWIKCYDATHREHPYAMECLRCGVKQRVALPISLDGYVALGKVFMKEHSRCKEIPQT